MGFIFKFFCALLLFLLHKILSLATIREGTQCIENERKALLSFKQGIIQDDDGMLSTWRDDGDRYEDCCNWKGVYCSNETGHIQSLNLSRLYLFGEINITLLSELHDIEYLDLSHNAFYLSEIPESIESFTKLRYLNLFGSSFVGTIPHQLGKLSKLEHLYLGLNHLTGVIPFQLGNLSMLQTLHLGSNSNLTLYDGQNNYEANWLSKLSSLSSLDLTFVGDVGYSHLWLQMIGKLTKLRVLKLAGCGISYTHNPSLTAFPLNHSSSLVILDLSANNLNFASFQYWPFNSSSINLQELYLSDCNISTTDIHFLFSHSQLSPLIVLDLSCNNLMSLRAVNFISSNLQVLNLRNCSLSSDNIIFTSFNPNLTFLVHLDLSFNLLTSTSIFHWISNFTFNLHKILLSDNLLEGPIPDGFGNIMNSLEVLDLFFNKLQGEMPTSLGNICTLEALYLSYNNFSGELSSFIQNTSWCNQMKGMSANLSVFSFLESLDLSYNQLKGEIPESIGLLSQLRYLSLDGNNLAGVVTESHFEKLSNLKTLSLSGNSLLTLQISTRWIQLQGLEFASCKLGRYFPDWLRNQHKLEILDISNCGISGFIPEWFWPKLKYMYHMNISYNNFVGKIPNLPLVINYDPELILTSNNFEGAVPSFFLQASALHLAKNKFSSLFPFPCGQIQDERLVLYLDVSNNQLEGSLPDCWSHMKLLVFVDLSNNNLSGVIPTSIGQLVDLQALVLRNNSFIGELPSSLVNCSQLLLLDVSENKLLGSIPSWVGENLGHLQILSLRMNNFYGKIPLHLCCLTHIRLLDLSHNKLSDEIPSCLQNFTALAHDHDYIDSADASYHLYQSSKTGVGYFNLHFYDFYVTLVWKGQDNLFKSPERFLKSLDLSSNSLTGEIPKEVASLLGLVSLNLSRNKLNGKIPTAIGNLGSLEFLDMSRNRLSGPIPSSLAHIDRLSVLDLSSNRLSGKIPIGTQLQSFNSTSYEGNLDLCGLPLEKCPGDEPPTPQHIDHFEDDDSYLTGEFYLSSGLGFAFGFWAFTMPLLFNHSLRQTYYTFFRKGIDRVHVLVAVYVARYITNQ